MTRYRMMMALAKAAEGTARKFDEKGARRHTGRCPYRQRLVCDCAKQGDRNQTVEDCKGRCHPRPTSGLHV